MLLLLLLRRRRREGRDDVPRVAPRGALVVAGATVVSGVAASIPMVMEADEGRSDGGGVSADAAGGGGPAGGRGAGNVVACDDPDECGAWRCGRGRGPRASAKRRGFGSRPSSESLESLPPPSLPLLRRAVEVVSAAVGLPRVRRSVVVDAAAGRRPLLSRLLRLLRLSGDTTSGTSVVVAVAGHRTPAPRPDVEAAGGDGDGEGGTAPRGESRKLSGKLEEEAGDTGPVVAGGSVAGGASRGEAGGASTVWEAGTAGGAAAPHRACDRARRSASDVGCTDSVPSSSVEEGDRAVPDELPGVPPALSRVWEW